MCDEFHLIDESSGAGHFQLGETKCIVVQKRKGIGNSNFSGGTSSVADAVRSHASVIAG